MTCLSWNVNGLRAVLRKGFLGFLERESPDVICLQETKAHPEDVPVAWPEGYHAEWNWALKKGYSGTLVLSRHEPLRVQRGIGCAAHDDEGRVLTVEFPGWFLVNVYVPNAKRDLSRLGYRQEWDRDFLQFLKALDRQKPVVVCGDMNVAHQPIDLTHPRANEGKHGYTAEERAGFQALLDAGWVDSFRHFCPDPGHYTWWSQMNRARERNVGWRIDYFLVSSGLKDRLKRAFIRPDVTGSDHCPVGIEWQPGIVCRPSASDVR
jgi:exodeoxyribonuclease-3